MRLKHAFFIATIFLATKSYSQITTTKIEVKEKVQKQKVYDGKSNFEVFKDIEGYKQYIGQKIYTTKSRLPIYTSTGEEYTDCHNKYFTIKNVIQEEIDPSNNYGEREINFFELINDENGEIYYYKLGKSYNSGAGWINDGIQPSIILVPYFLNLKKTYENKKYVIVSYWRKDGFTNETTNEWVVVNKPLYGGEWNCEVSVVEKDGKEKIFYIMKNNSGEIISSETVDNESPDKFSIIKKRGAFTNAGLFFMSVEDYNSENATKKKEKKDVITQKNNVINKLTPKYGKEKAVLISSGKVEIGMTRQMCVDAWGVPLYSKILKTKKGTTETLLYNWNRKLYLENGILAKIED